MGAPGAHLERFALGLRSKPDFIEKLLDPIKPAMGLWAVLAAAPRQGLIQLLNQLNLLLAEMDWGFQSNPAHEVARRPPSDGFDALAAQSEHPAGLSFLRNLECHLAG